MMAASPVGQGPGNRWKLIKSHAGGPARLGCTFHRPPALVSTLEIPAGARASAEGRLSTPAGLAPHTAVTLNLRTIKPAHKDGSKRPDRRVLGRLKEG